MHVPALVTPVETMLPLGMLNEPRSAVAASAPEINPQGWKCPVCNESRSSAAWQRRHLDYFRCLQCGLLADHRLPRPDEINEYYRSRAQTGNYSPTLSTFDDQRKAVYRANLRRWSSWTGQSPKGKRILDVGCFTGISLEAISEDGGEPYGIELQEHAAAVAGAKFPGRVAVGDICTIDPPFPPLDLVTMTDVIDKAAIPGEGVCY